LGKLCRNPEVSGFCHQLFAGFGGDFYDSAFLDSGMNCCNQEKLEFRIAAAGL
jgi:hypothetical protein